MANILARFFQFRSRCWLKPKEIFPRSEQLSVLTMHQKLQIPRLTTLIPPPIAYSEGGRSLKHPLLYPYLLPKVEKEPFKGKLQWDQSADNPLSRKE